MITFDNTSKELILSMLGKAVDTDGYIFDIATRQRVLSPEGNEVLLEDFAGIKKGSEIFITKDLPSLLTHVGSTETVG